MFWTLSIGIWNLPFDLAQGGELVEPFVIWCSEFGILSLGIMQLEIIRIVVLLPSGSLKVGEVSSPGHRALRNWDHHTVPGPDLCGLP
jgi:hypothetical protein